MLDPSARHVYLDALRPPPDFQLDRAVATTFSLDLLTLLAAPLSFALFECDHAEQALANPIAVLEALRRATGKFTVFCQRGRISVPRFEKLLFGYLEPVGHAAVPGG